MTIRNGPLDHMWDPRDNNAKEAVLNHYEKRILEAYMGFVVGLLSKAFRAERDNPVPA